MNAKVEEALNWAEDALERAGHSPDGPEMMALYEARAQQNATIARLIELVRAVKSSDYEISCGDVSTGNWFDARTALIAALNQEQVK